MKALYDRKELKDLLRESVIRVNFTKADGTVRDLKCTLVYDLIPMEQRPADKMPTRNSSRPENFDTITVFDVENAGWRSFRLDSINFIEV